MSRAHITLEVRTPDGLFHRAEYALNGQPKKPDGAFYLRYTESNSRKCERLGTTDPNEAALLLHKREAQLAAVEHGVVSTPTAPINPTTLFPNNGSGAVAFSLAAVRPTSIRREIAVRRVSCKKPHTGAAAVIARIQENRASISDDIGGTAPYKELVMLVQRYQLV